MLWHYLVLIALFGVRSVQAGNDWEDFANNFATDLAPLVALFGERLTKQFLAESTSLLDNYIFGVCPLGILTAVVSVIRICGNSSLRAFVGRANEAPGEAENELLSCVSEGTAELFNDGGISRVLGRPRILEVIVYEENGSYKIGNLRDALKSGAWYTDGVDMQYEQRLLLLPEIDIPNLSLNKGIKRRGVGWFYSAALLGTVLQAGTLAYAAMTVFCFSSIFGGDEDSADSYALPLYFFGSTSLSLGMFLCGFLIERSSRESYIYPTNPSKIYWLQPGRQTIGDQDFGAFLAGDEGPNLTYIKSIRGLPPKGKRPLLVFTICITMIGFVSQFVGLRGLHPSVILADVGSTLLMAVVRTCLRTKRIGSEENKFHKEDQKLFSQNQQELDCFSYHLEKVKSFHLMSSPVHQAVRSRSGSCSTSDSSLLSNQPSGLAARLIQTRARLAELTSCSRHSSMNWDDLPIRKVAHNLARTVETTIEVVSRWKELPSSTRSFELTFACHPEDDKSRGSLETYSLKLSRSEDTFQWKIDVNELEAILGLWSFSLLKSDPKWSQNRLMRAVGLTKQEAGAEATDLYFHKWIFRQREAIPVSSGLISFPEQTFGCYSDDHSGTKDILAVRTDNKLEAMAAQDVYIQFLMAILEGLESLGGHAEILSVSQNNFLAQCTELDELVSCFEAGNLGSREDALLCIVPVLKHRSLLPELAGDTSTVRNQVQGLISAGNWDGAFSMLKWLCERCEGEEFEHSVYELGFLCLRAMMNRENLVIEKGLKVTCSLLQADLRASFFRRLGRSRPPHWIETMNQQEWWVSYSRQLGWVTWRILDTKGDRHGMKTFLEALGISRDLTCQSNEMARDSQLTLLQWLIPELEFGPRPESFSFEDDRYMESCLGWMTRNKQKALCYWFLACWVKLGQHYPEAAAKAFKYAATSESDFAVQFLHRRGTDINASGPTGCTALIELVEEQNIEASRRLLTNGADVNACAVGSGVPPLSFAAEQGNEELLILLLDFGAGLEVSDLGALTPLRIACEANRLNIIVLLLDRGADIETVAGDGNTPLVAATIKCELEMARLLLERGANVEAADIGGNTPLILAVLDGFEAFVPLLIQNKADIHKHNDFGKTALDRARELGQTEVVAMFEAALLTQSTYCPR